MQDKNGQLEINNEELAKLRSALGDLSGSPVKMSQTLL
jgi:hypothetical protein